MKNIVLLGSTGSVGRNVLDVVRHYPDLFRVRAISSNANVSALAEQAREFKPDTVAVGSEGLYTELKQKLPEGIKTAAGPGSLEEMASGGDADIIFIAISGTAALRPLVAALRAGRTVALASKEPVVSAGAILRKLAEENRALILPVDSEHSAVMQCLAGRSVSDVRTLYITGSGGPLRSTRPEEFDSLSIERILDHPKWKMGPKITVDSATLMNKGLEAIEARWLFDIVPEKIKIVIHPEAVIHSMVEFLDGTMTAGMFSPDMRFPILKALSHPDIIASSFPRVDFSRTKELSFYEPDRRKFPALDLAFAALGAGGTMPAVLNGANETAVKLYLEGRIAFRDIVTMVGDVMASHAAVKDPTLDEVILSEKWASEEVLRFC